MRSLVYQFTGSFLFVSLLFLGGCKSGQLRQSALEEKTVITKEYSNEGDRLTISMLPGKHHNYPSFAIWVEDVYGQLIQTLFVTRSIANGYFRHGQTGEGRWLTEAGEAVRPAALPYWLHKREGYDPDKPSLPSRDNPFPDAYTGATPPAALQLEVNSLNEMPDIYRLLVEVNQPWDFNDYWHNNRFPDHADYKTSAQPSVIYAVTIGKTSATEVYYLNPIGHGHYAGENGSLYTDLSTFTTALDIFKEIKVIRQ